MKMIRQEMLRLLGRDSAPEHGSLALSVPSVYRRLAALETDPKALGRHLAAAAGPAEKVGEAGRYLNQLNRSVAAAETRWELTNVAMAALSPAVVSLYSRYALEPSDFPESEERRAALSQAITAVERAAVSYKLVLAHDWARSGRGYETRRERVRHCAAIVMELIRVQQWLRALRRQRLPRCAWHDAHEIYFALRRQEPVARAVPHRVRLALHPGTRGEVPLVSPVGSLEQVYASIQLVGALDVAAAASAVPYLAQSYVEGLGAPLAVSAYDGVSPIAPGQLVCRRGWQGPPGFTRIPEQGGEAVLIDITPLRDALAADRAALAQDSAHAPRAPAMATVPGQARLAVIDAMLRKLRPRTRRDARRPIYNVQYASVYFGFPETFRLLRDLMQDNSLRHQDRTFRDALAEHSAKLDSHDCVNQARWLVVDVSAQGIQLAVEEGRFTVPVQIGALVAYRLLADASGSPRVGYVVRLHRTGERDIEMAIAALGQEVESIALQHADGVHAERLLPALLLRDTGDGARLLIAEREGLAPGAAVHLNVRRRRHAARLGQVLLSQPDFNVYALEAQE